MRLWSLTQELASGLSLHQQLVLGRCHEAEERDEFLGEGVDESYRPSVVQSSPWPGKSQASRSGQATPDGSGLLLYSFPVCAQSLNRSCGKHEGP